MGKIPPLVVAALVVAVVFMTLALIFAVTEFRDWRKRRRRKNPPDDPEYWWNGGRAPKLHHDEPDSSDEFLLDSPTENE